MTYAQDILSKDAHQIGYYIRFDGITSPKLSTHSTIANTLPVLIGVPQGSATELDRARSLIMPGGFSCEVMSTAETDELFSINGGTVATLQTSLSRTQTALSFNEGTPYPVGSAIYVEKETIILGPIAFGFYTSCVRGQASSENQEHAAGAIASDRPRYFMGRRAQLYAVDLETGNEAVIRTGVLSSSPTFNNGVYRLQFVDMQRELNRRIFTGWQSQACSIEEDSYTIEQGTTSFIVNISRPDEFVTALAQESHVKINFNDSFAVFRIEGSQVDSANNQVTIKVRDTGQSYLVAYGGAVDDENAVSDFFAGNIAPDGSNSELSIMTVGFLRGPPAQIALQVMTSDLGKQINGFYDILPGQTQASTTTAADTLPRRIGASLPEAWVDDAAFIAVIEGIANTTIILDETTRLIDFLENEIAWILGGYIFINDEGKISFKKYNPAVPQGSIDSYDESDVVQQSRSITLDESEIIASGIIECDYDYARREYMRKIEVQWQPTYNIYGEGRAQINFKSKSIKTSDSRTNVNTGNQPVNELQLVTQLDRIYSRTKDGVTKVQLSIPWKYSKLFTPGYVFQYSDTVLPFEGATGFTNQQFEVVGVSPNYEAGRVVVTAEAQPRGWLVAPACYVDSYDAGTFTVTIDTTGDEALLFDGNPGEDFIEDCKVLIYEAAASPSFSASTFATVASVTATSITFAAAPFVLPAPGDLVVMDLSANTGNVNTTGADVEDHIFCSDSNVSPPDLGFGVVGNKWS